MRRVAAFACAMVWMGLAACADEGPASKGSSSGRGGSKDSGLAPPDATDRGTGGAAGSGGSGGGSGGEVIDGGVIDAPKEAPVLAMPGPIDVRAIAVEGPTRWKYDAKGAYTLIHDDTCADKLGSHYAVANQELTSRGLRVGFGAIAGFCAGEADLLNQYLSTYLQNNPQVIKQQWDEVRKLVANGHEIVNHTFSHTLDQEPNGLPAVDAGRWHMEIDHARELLETNLGLRVSYFIFPYDERTDEQIAYLAAQGYAGARGGMRTDGFNAFDFKDPLRVDFAVYHVEPGDVPNALNQTVTTAIDKGGWGMREVHGVGDAPNDGWEPIPLAQYRAHLDFLKQKVDEGALWVDGPTAVTRYRFARSSCAAPTTAGNKLVFSTLSDACRTYATPLSFRVTIEPSAPAKELVAIQGTEYVPTSQLPDGRYFVHVDPTRGDVTLSAR